MYFEVESVKTVHNFFLTDDENCKMSEHKDSQWDYEMKYLNIGQKVLYILKKLPKD